MGKLIASVILGLCLLFLAWEAVVSLRPDTETKQDMAAQKKMQPVAPPEKTVTFYPPVPAVLPDLNQGYLFNAERFLPGGAKESGDAAEGNGEEGTEVTVDIETVFYAGSIISGATRKGLIVYPAAAGQAGPASGEATQGASPLKPRKYAQLVVGDTVSGYTVELIEADRLVLKKGEESIEKLLNDPKKERIAPPPPPPKPQVAPKPASAPAARPTADNASNRSAVRRMPPSQRVGAPRQLPANMTIQIPGAPRNN